MEIATGAARGAAKGAREARRVNVTTAARRTTMACTQVWSTTTSKSHFGSSTGIQNGSTRPVTSPPFPFQQPPCHLMPSSAQPHRSPPPAARARAVFGPLPGPPIHSPTRKKRSGDAPTAKSKPILPPTGQPKGNDSTDLLVSKRLAKAAASKSACLDLSRSNTRVFSEPTASPNTDSQQLTSPFRSFPPVLLTRMALAGSLKQLWLTNHALAALPAEIGELQRLQVLGLGGNALTSLPPELSLLPNLERLYLERNRLQVLAASLELPRSLRDLRLDHNALTVFPMPVTRLRLLNRLGLSHNQLHGELPAKIGRLRNLVELDLDHNALGPAFPVEMKQLRRLERLGVQGNCLSPAGVDEVLKSLPSLVYVRVSGNRGGLDGQSHSENQPEAASDDGSGRMTAPRRHDGYFQTTCGYREDKSSIAVVDGEEHECEDSSRRGERNNLLTSRSPPPLPGIVPCRALNLGNAELYRSRST